MPKRHTTPSQNRIRFNCRQKRVGGKKKTRWCRHRKYLVTRCLPMQQTLCCSTSVRERSRTRTDAGETSITLSRSTPLVPVWSPVAAEKCGDLRLPRCRWQKHSKSWWNSSITRRRIECKAGFASRSGRTSSKSPSIATLNASTGPPRLSLWARRQRCRDMHRISAKITRLFTHQSQPFSCRFPPPSINNTLPQISLTLTSPSFVTFVNPHSHGTGKTKFKKNKNCWDIFFRPLVAGDYSLISPSLSPVPLLSLTFGTGFHLTDKTNVLWHEETKSSCFASSLLFSYFSSCG